MLESQSEQQGMAPSLKRLALEAARRHRAEAERIEGGNGRVYHISFTATDEYGAECSGEVQVITDLLGMTGWQPRHARPFADLRATILDAARRYAEEVAAGTFPGAEQTVRMEDSVLDEVLGRSALDQPMEAAPIPLDRDL